jgi:hypothetical protein
MQTQNIKTIARQLIDQLPETCIWDDLMKQIYIQQTIASGLPIASFKDASGRHPT